MQKMQSCAGDIQCTTLRRVLISPPIKSHSINKNDLMTEKKRKREQNGKPKSDLKTSCWK